MKLISTTDAVGHVLCHDITRIIPGKEKGPVFRKGHIVREEDIPVLLSVGKEHLYVWEKKEGILHEDEAADILRDICMGNDPSMDFSEPKEGKVEIRSKVRGLLKIDRDKLMKINSLGRMMIATVGGDRPVNAGDKIAATRIIPLVIEEDAMNEALKIKGDKPLLRILPFPHIRYGLVTTGNELYKGRIDDAFGPVLRARMDEFDCEFTGQTILPDDMEMIASEVLSYADKGCDIILVSGGMSVDPDDMTPGAIKSTGAEIVSYGAPVLPGAMFLLSYLKFNGRTVTVMGLPGCVMYAKRTVFDLVLPRIIAGERLTDRDLAAFGEGGLCLGCDICHFPNCGFGR